MQLYKLPDGTVLNGVHPRTACEGRACVIHNPSNHYASNWEMVWDNEQALVYRVCPHDNDVLDPDQFDYLVESRLALYSYDSPCGCGTYLAGPKVRCRDCGDTVQSMSRHDYVPCFCGQTAVDGGYTYTRITGSGEVVE